MLTPEQIETRKKWIQKLRSGEYRQGHHSLRTGKNHFCCLGVLCDIVEPEAWTELHPASVYEHRAMSGFPSPVILSKVGITEEQVQVLAGKNDRGASFDQIADDLETWTNWTNPDYVP